MRTYTNVIKYYVSGILNAYLSLEGYYEGFRSYELYILFALRRTPYLYVMRERLAKNLKQ